MVASEHKNEYELIARLEAEAVHVIREAVASAKNPAILFSGGKDSTVMLHLARKALWPSREFPTILHVDTGHNFDEALDFRDRTVSRLGARLVVASVQSFLDRGLLEERADGTRNALQTLPLLDAIKGNEFDVVFGGARRDEEKARAKERIFSLRESTGAWTPRNQRPELWNLYNAEYRRDEHLRVFPISNWTEQDVWSYVYRESIELPSLYFAHNRRVFEKDGMLLADSPYVRREVGNRVETLSVRYRTVGDMSCTGAVRSNATTVLSVIDELAATRLTERGATRADDRVSATAMEDRKNLGYF